MSKNIFFEKNINGCNFLEKSICVKKIMPQNVFMVPIFVVKKCTWNNITPCIIEKNTGLGEFLPNRFPKIFRRNFCMKFK